MLFRRRVLYGASLWAALWAGGHAYASSTYDARLRFQPGAGGAAVDGYNVYVRAVSGPYAARRDVGLPSPDADGFIAVAINGLDVRMSYVVAVTAYDAAGEESGLSNEIGIGYRQAAALVDSDEDGLSDAEEDPDLDQVVDAEETDPEDPDSDGDGVSDRRDRCRATAPGNAVEPDGCPPCEELQLQRIKLSAREDRYTAAARAVISPSPALDVLRSGAAIEIRDDAGTTLYRGEIPAQAFEPNVSGRVLRFRQGASMAAPIRANGIKELTVSVANHDTALWMVASGLDLEDVHAAPVLTWIVRSGNSCFRHVGLACSSRSQHIVRCD
jgi:hypothetical protein